MQAGPSPGGLQLPLLICRKRKAGPQSSQFVSIIAREYREAGVLGVNGLNISKTPK